MFIISQCALHKSHVCNFHNISTYSIASGLIIYGGIYLYLLFYKNEYLALFNKFIIYIIGIDLLLSTFYYINSQNNLKNNYVLLESTNTNIDEMLSESTSEDKESDFEIDLDDVDTEDQFQTIDTEQLQENLETHLDQTPNTNQDNIYLNENLNENANENANENEVKEQQDQMKKLDIDTTSEPTLKKKRGRKPNSLKSQVNF